MQEVEETSTKLVDVIVLTDNLITIDKTQYKLVENHDSGFNEERIEERYNNVLEKYDYIVGDWGYDQLRFKGFYEDERKESTLENRISHLEDYLLEYCNFGCAYFVLEKVKKAPLKTNHRRSRNKTSNHNNRPKSNHKFRTRTNNNHTKTNAKATTKPTTKSGNKNKAQSTSQKHKNKVAKRRVNNNNSNNKKKPTTTAKKTFKIRKIGEKNK